MTPLSSITFLLISRLLMNGAVEVGDTTGCKVGNEEGIGAGTILGDEDGMLVTVGFREGLG